MMTAQQVGERLVHHQFSAVPLIQFKSIQCVTPSQTIRSRRSVVDRAKIVEMNLPDLACCCDAFHGRIPWPAMALFLCGVEINVHLLTNINLLLAGLNRVNHLQDSGVDALRSRTGQ